MSESGGGKPVSEKPRAGLGLEGITAGYGVVSVLRDVSLRVEPGEIVAVLGTNGAGKSTLLKAVVGLLRPTGGRIAVGGEDVTGSSPEEMTRRGVVLVPEGRQLFAEMTVRENLILGAYIHRRKREARERELERVLGLFPVLGERMNSPAADLSGGQQQMLAVGRGMMARPSILLLDEPSLGLAPLVTKEMFSAFEALRESGITMVIVEQQAMMTLKLADRAYVIERGRIVVEGEAEGLIDDDRVRSAYLGLDVSAGGDGHGELPEATAGPAGG